ncbi:hypothetical protein K438DRAFT_1824245 [Mycena galopus ATCC 62051]|nr:hypothetical protein K438DRAFT_1824245 [Mycena galopus ATCC 62051]
MGMYNSEPDSICDNAAAVAVALPILQAQSVLAMTCQGYALGYKDGSPSILSFATVKHPSHVFHFDLIILDRATLQPLFDILCSTSVIKAVFDGRLIASALLHDCGVELVNALDMQLADITSRTLRGESAKRQLSRLSNAILSHENDISSQESVPKSIIHAHPEWYRSLLRLNEAEQCAKEHGIQVGRSGQRRLMLDTAEEWISRPLSPWSCKYATDRVYLISAIYADFHAKGYIFPSLAAQSARYLSLHRGRQPELGSGHCPILPLGIITTDPVRPGNEPLCSTCGRAFTETHMREESCLVCFGVKKAQEERNMIIAIPDSVYYSDSDESDDASWEDW